MQQQYYAHDGSMKLFEIFVFVFVFVHLQLHECPDRVKEQLSMYACVCKLIYDIRLNTYRRCVEQWRWTVQQVFRL